MEARQREEEARKQHEQDRIRQEQERARIKGGRCVVVYYYTKRAREKKWELKPSQVFVNGDIVQTCMHL